MRSHHLGSSSRRVGSELRLSPLPMEWLDAGSWRLPSGKALAEFALQAGFLAPLLFEDGASGQAGEFSRGSRRSGAQQAVRERKQPVTPQCWIAGIIGVAAVADDLRRRQISNWISCSALAADWCCKWLQHGGKGAVTALAGPLPARACS